MICTILLIYIIIAIIWAYAVYRMIMKGLDKPDYPEENIVDVAFLEGILWPIALYKLIKNLFKKR